jgi:hypothetical protein
MSTKYFKKEKILICKIIVTISEIERNLKAVWVINNSKTTKCVIEAK